MSFLQPILLIAIVAAGIPLILHLLTLRRLKVVPFSTLSFLKELQRSRVRAVRLRQLLLLLLRTLLVLLLVLAFARPALQGAFSPILGSASTRDVLVMIDDSYSMSVRDQNGTFARQAEEAARAVIEGLAAEDRVLVLPMSAVRSGRTVSDQEWVSPEAGMDLIKAIPQSPVHISLERALSYGATLLSSQLSANRDLYVISDFQRGMAASSPIREESFDESLHATFIRVGEPIEENMSFGSVDLTSSIIEVASPASFSIRLKNHRSDAPRTANVSMFLRSERIDQRVQTIGSQEEAELRLQGTPQRSGFQTGSIVLDGDDIDFDNRYWYVLHIPEERDVLVVGDEQETYYTTTALSASRSDVRSGFRIRRVRATQLTPALIRDPDVLIIIDAELREDLLRTLLERVNSGSGIIVLPGTSSGPDVPGKTVAGVLGSAFLPGQMSVAEGGFLTFGRTDLEHPVFEGMFTQVTDAGGRRTSRIESPDIISYARHERPRGAGTIISMSNSSPFLTESRIGSGRVLIYAVPFIPTWSTFPVSGLFVPLLHRSVVYVSGNTAFRPSIEPGEEITIPLPRNAADQLRLRSPDGVESPAQPVVLPTGPVFRTTEAILPGVYALFSGDNELERFAVNLSPLESDPGQLSPDEMVFTGEASGLAPGSVMVLEQGEDIADRIYAARVGSELWGLLLLLALIVAIAETWLAGTLRPDSSQANPA